MKYKLTIEGTKEEIEKAKLINWVLYGELSNGCVTGDYDITPEFKTVEPRYRVKTLGELAAEFGSDLQLITDNTMIACTKCVPPVVAELSELGNHIELKGWVRHASEQWKQVFLKEVTND